MSRSHETCDELRRLVAGTKSRPKDFWEEIFGSDDALFYDAEGNNRTDLFRAPIERVDHTPADLMNGVGRLREDNTTGRLPAGDIERLRSEQRV